MAYKDNQNPLVGEMTVVFSASLLASQWDATTLSDLERFMEQELHRRSIDRYRKAPAAQKDKMLPDLIPVIRSIHLSKVLLEDTPETVRQRITQHERFVFAVEDPNGKDLTVFLTKASGSEEPFVDEVEQQYKLPKKPILLPVLHRCFVGKRYYGPTSHDRQQSTAESPIEAQAGSNPGNADLIETVADEEEAILPADTALANNGQASGQLDDVLLRADPHPPLSTEPLAKLRSAESLIKAIEDTAYTLKSLADGHTNTTVGPASTGQIIQPQASPDKDVSSPVTEPPSQGTGKLGDEPFYQFYRALLANAEVRLTDDIEEPVTCLEVVTNGVETPVGTFGNFSLIIGQPKSRKTFLLSAIVASCITGDPVTGIRGLLPAGKKTVLYFDTEQHKSHLKRALVRMSTMANDDNLQSIRVFDLRKHPTNHRLNAIRVAIDDTPNLGLIVIDGIRDTVFDINDPKEATERATDLLQWTEEKNAHLIAVIHENKNNHNARGHLGTELVNKAETVMSVARDADDKQISLVIPEYCRNREFVPFAFSIDEQGCPYLIDEVPVQPGKSAARLTAGRMKPEDITRLLQRALPDGARLGYNPFRTSIIESSEFIGMSLGKSQAETLIARLLNEAYVTKEKTGKDRYDKYQINLEKQPA